jgi:hypothetical protein
VFKGEIDILEGVNDHGQNLVTLHTTPGTRFKFTLRDMRFSVINDRSRLHHARITCHDRVRCHDIGGLIRGSAFITPTQLTHGARLQFGREL